ncbi:polyhydroxybutyrate depolymerase [Yoonia maricola]|uniref:Polyhydroxybutyrate depolymerase n=1 Tax=Yoonia maricola TaxID=420999 RepID=A0A2M8W008_9RHOB|nr:alpha/beta fold hydrolase [Yoonia maricola]PJI84263.1 polyhydroxybutyrate depolymerase [Yoonia maricola]
MIPPKYAALLGAFLTVAGVSTTAAACSADTPCEVADGTYVVALPPDHTAPPPAVVFVHGFGGSGTGVMRRTDMVQTFTDRGYAVIAPDGLQRQGANGRSWSFHPMRPQRRDEIAFLTAVRDDAIARHGIDPDRIILAGFSIGGSMTAYLACAAPDTFAAYVPVGGNFWRPHPTECAGPVRMLHTHGWTDGTVPLEGRVLRGTDSRDPGALMQGDVFHAMAIWRETNECFQLRPDGYVTEGPFLIREWTNCAPGSALAFALFPGGHVIPPDWSTLALDWFEAL